MNLMKCIAFVFVVSSSSIFAGASDIGLFEGEPSCSDSDWVRSLLPDHTAHMEPNWVDYKIGESRALVIWLHDDSEKRALLYAFRKDGPASWICLARETISHSPEKLDHVVIDGTDSAMLINSDGILMHSILFNPEP